MKSNTCHVWLSYLLVIVGPTLIFSAKSVAWADEEGCRPWSMEIACSILNRFSSLTYFELDEIANMLSGVGICLFAIGGALFLWRGLWRVTLAFLVIFCGCYVLTSVKGGIYCDGGLPAFANDIKRECSDRATKTSSQPPQTMSVTQISNF